MKKVLFLILFVFLLTGCQKDKLSCEKTVKSNGYTSSEIYQLKYSNDKLKDLKFVTEYKFNDFYTAEEIDSQYKTVLRSCNNFKEDSNDKIKCVPELKGKNIKVTITTNLNDIDEDTFENIMFVTLKELNNKNDTKKMFKNVGYTCK